MSVPIGPLDLLDHFFAGELRQSPCSRHEHALGDSSRSHVQRSPEYVREAQEIDDGVGMLGQGGRHDGVATAGSSLFVVDLGLRGGEREDEGESIHRTDHLLGQDTARRGACENVRAPQALLELPGGVLAGEHFLVRVEVLAVGVNQSVDVVDEQVLGPDRFHISKARAIRGATARPRLLIVQGAGDPSKKSVSVRSASCPI